VTKVLACGNGRRPSYINCGAEWDLARTRRRISQFFLNPATRNRGFYPYDKWVLAYCPRLGKSSARIGTDYSLDVRPTSGQFTINLISVVRQPWAHSLLSSPVLLPLHSMVGFQGPYLPPPNPCFRPRDFAIDECGCEAIIAPRPREGSMSLCVAKLYPGPVGFVSS
jgi:hypothetical protein